MEYDLKYNEQLDEFTTDLTIQSRLRKYADKHFYPAFAISMLCPIYLMGGAIRDLLMAKRPKDLDFVVVGKEHKEWVLKVFKKFNIDYTFNRFGGFRINYQGTKIDLWLTDDLFSSLEYNVDGLYYDLRNNDMLSLTFKGFTENGLKLVNPENNIAKGRELKLAKFAEEYHH